MSKLWRMLATGALLAGCAGPPPQQAGVDARLISAVDTATPRKQQPTPPAVESALLPPLRMEMPSVRGQPIDPRFDLSVNNAPAGQVFSALVAGTRYSMLLEPNLSGSITVNLKDVTLREALESIRDLYGYDFRFEGSRIFVKSAGLQTRFFRVNYMTGQRRGTSDVRVQSSAVSDVAAGAGTPGIAGGAPTAGTPFTASRALESSRVSTRQESDFWVDLRAALTAIVGSGEGRSVVITPQAGVVLVRAMPAELRSVENYLRETQISVERQVMLEAKIIEVTLSDSYQSGVNWAILNKHIAAGQVASQTQIGTAPNALVSRGLTGQPGSSLGTPVTGGGTSIAEAALLAANPSAGLFGLAVRVRDFAALLQFLQTQGNVQVLSSPRIATLNNQKAVLKVGTDQFFVTNITSTSTTTATTAGAVAATPIPSVTVQPFFSGIVLDVTPQIDDNNQVILHIHPSVSQVSTDNKVITLGTAGELNLPLARSDVSESDTIVRVTDGNLVALGGLMKLSLSDNRGGLPGAPETGVGGALLRNTDRQVVKKELVILLKPTIIQSDRTWEQDIREARDRLESLSNLGPRPSEAR
ncbi:MAG TPA: secretin N-terminal domain-containing protein [Burkholderiales bacterium]|nr:secretin N-terminal domain-containing protein [Burkholderiales bacterium]